MSGITAILNIAQGALRANQLAMEVVSHNIANANTPGYTRQKAILGSESPVSVNELKIGMGVRVDMVAQSFDGYTTRVIHQNASSLAENEAKASVLSYLESIFDETTGQGLSAALADFWGAWQDLANNPGAIPERTALLSKAEALSAHFHAMNADLNQTRATMNSNLTAALEETNQITGQIAALNARIVASESGGAVNNDLRDQRNNYLEKLSSLMGVHYLENQDGSLTILSAEGLLMVGGNQSWDFSRAGDEIFWNGVADDVSSRLVGGKIAAYLDIRDEVVPQYRANLDELAGTLIEQINTIHSSGFTPSGATGINFFEALSNPIPGDHTGAAALIRLSEDLGHDPANLAAAGQPGAPGDNENALRIANLQLDQTLQVRKWSYADRGASITSSLQSITLEDYYRTLVGDMGLLANGANQDRDFAQTVMDRLQELRDSVSGVNLDEEMTELLKFQRTYEAASKIIAIVDEMLQSLIQLR